MTYRLKTIALRAYRSYNIRVPTPFYHLDIAENLLANPALANPVQQFLWGQRSAFLLGNTAPDVQVVSRQERQATHFFSLPVRTDAQPPWERLLRTHPSLAQPARIPGAQAAFIAGYLCHLQADWLWIVDIFAPVFGPDCRWETFSQRLYLHNVLRAYLDQQVTTALAADTADCLKGIRPDHWLPFVQDVHLSTWRDYLAGQLEPGAAAETVEVFASRQGLSPREFYQLIESEERMEQEVFVHLPRSQLETYHQRLIESNLELLQAYFGPQNKPKYIPVTGLPAQSGSFDHQTI